jgi:mannose-6-phosphate isomerase-like protein (cupin superfamily)
MKEKPMQVVNEHEATLGHIDEEQAQSALGMRCQRLFEAGSLGAIACFLGPHESSAADRHPDSEAMIVLSGKGTAECAGQRFELVPDDVLLVPGEMTHVMHNSSSEPLAWLAIYWVASEQPRESAA